ncbi:MAG: haloacid dehalogenase, partial [Chloroflexales bacterium]|nr:haloacid dehalogenase [Chloroflexales bacterium]
MQLQECVAAAVATIDERHRAREAALTSSRALIRQCANTIRAAHR